MALNRRSTRSDLRICILGRADYILLQTRADHLAAQGHDVHVLSLQKGISGAYTVHPLKPATPLSSLNYSAALPQIRSHLARLKPDVIDVHGISSYGAYGLAPASQTPYVATIYGPDLNLQAANSRLIAGIARSCLRRATLVYSSTPVTRGQVEQVLGLRLGERFVSRSWGIPAGEILNNAAERRRVTRQELGVGRETRVLLHNRHFNSFWRVSTLIESMERLVRRFPDTELWFVYTPPNTDGQREVEAAKQQIEARHLIGHVRLLGPQSYARMIDTMHAADLFVCIGPNDLLASSVLEALATGLIPVLSNLPAYREVIEHRHNGFLLDEVSAERICEQVGEVLGAFESWRQAIAEPNRTLVERDYDMTATTRWLVDRYREAVTAAARAETRKPTWIR